MTRRNRPRPQQRRSGRRVDRREGDPLRNNVLGDAVEADAHLGDHGKRSLRSDEQAREVVAGGRLPRPGRPCGRSFRRRARPRARGRWRASSRSGSSSSRPHSSRPCRRASRPHRGRREEEPVLACRSFERGSRDARLDGRAQILRGDLHDPVQAREIEADAACVGITWPSRLEPAPNGVTATRRSLAIAITRETSSVEDG